MSMPKKIPKMEKYVQRSFVGIQRSPKGLKTSLVEELGTQTLLQM